MAGENNSARQFENKLVEVRCVGMLFSGYEGGASTWGGGGG